MDATALLIAATSFVVGLALGFFASRLLARLSMLREYFKRGSSIG